MRPVYSRLLHPKVAEQMPSKQRRVAGREGAKPNMGIWTEGKAGRCGGSKCRKEPKQQRRKELGEGIMGKTSSLQMN